MSRSNSQAVVSAPVAAYSPPSEGSDPVLVAVHEARAGDPEGMRRFLVEIAPWVRRTCNGVLGSGHPDLDDTMQECLFAALKALGSYRFDGDIRHYVTKIALRIAIGAKRTSVARWHQHDLLKAEPQSEVPAPVPADWSSDEIDLVRRMLDNLSRLQSEALLMRIVLGFSVEEIAATTGVSRNTVKTRLRLGKNALRKNLRKTPFWANWLSRKNS